MSGSDALKMEMKMDMQMALGRRREGLSLAVSDNVKSLNEADLPEATAYW